MAYTPKTWVTGEVIEAVDLNHIENGIKDISDVSADYPIPDLESGQFLVGGTDSFVGRKIVKEDLNMANGTVLCTHGTTGLFNGMPFSATATSNTFPIRDFSGRVAVADGTAQDNAINLKQLNERAGTALPLYNNANANAGTSTLFSRQDHVHPLQATVGALSAGRTFYFTGGMTATSPPFNGSENITVATTLAVPTSTVRGGVLKQNNIPDMDDSRPVDVEDINAILAVLRGAGLM